MKIVSKGNYTFIYEQNKNDIECTAFFNGNHMKQSDIARYLGFTRAAISQILKRSLQKIYYQTKKKNKHLNPIEVTSMLAEILGVKTMVQYSKFFESLPSKVKKEIRDYAYEKKYVKA